MDLRLAEVVTAARAHRLARLVGLAIALAALLGACGAPEPSPLGPRELAGTLPGGQVLKVTIDDRTALLEGASLALPDADFSNRNKGGLALRNPVDDPKRLLVGWLGGACATASAVVIVDRSGSRISISVREPWTLQGCQFQAGQVKAVELRFSTAMPEEMVDGIRLRD
jgi:hypothetical protein